MMRATAWVTVSSRFFFRLSLRLNTARRYCRGGPALSSSSQPPKQAPAHACIVAGSAAVFGDNAAQGMSVRKEATCCSQDMGVLQLQP